MEGVVLSHAFSADVLPTSIKSIDTNPRNQSLNVNPWNVTILYIKIDDKHNMNLYSLTFASFLIISKIEPYKIMDQCY